MGTEILIGAEPENEAAEAMTVLHDTMKTYCTTKPERLPTLQEMKAKILEYLEQPIPKACPGGYSNTLFMVYRRVEGQPGPP